MPPAARYRVPVVTTEDHVHLSHRPRTLRRILAFTLAAALGTAACGGSGGGDAVDLGTADLSTQAAAGAQVYVARCAGCHSTDMTGASGPALGPGSGAAGRSLDTLRATITGGAPGMPAWGGTLTAEQIDEVMALLSEVQGR